MCNKINQWLSSLILYGRRSKKGLYIIVCNTPLISLISRFFKTQPKSKDKIYTTGLI